MRWRGMFGGFLFAGDDEVRPLVNGKNEFSFDNSLQKQLRYKQWPDGKWRNTLLKVTSCCEQLEGNDLLLCDGDIRGALY